MEITLNVIDMNTIDDDLLSSIYYGIHRAYKHSNETISEFQIDSLANTILDSVKMELWEKLTSLNDVFDISDDIEIHRAGFNILSRYKLNQCNIRVISPQNNAEPFDMSQILR